MTAPIRPSETGAGVQFVEAFANEDQPLARLLLDSLKLVDEGQFMSGLANVLDRAVSTLDGAVGLIPVGELPRPVEEGVEDENEQAATREDRTSYENVDSRSIVKLVCRNLRTTRPEIIGGWGIESLRRDKVRHLVFVDDFLASGRSLRTTAKRWLEHPTVRSWRSYGYLHIHAVTYAATSRGIARAQELEIPLTCYDRSCDLRAAALRSENIGYKDSRRLISKYGTGSKRGFGNAEGMLVIQHTVPNSLPSIFRQERKSNGDDWPHLFNRDTYEMLGDLKSAWPFSPAKRTEDLLLQHLPDLRPSWIETQTDANLETILVSHLTVGRKQSREEISWMLDLPLDGVERALVNAQVLGLDNAVQLHRELRLASSPGQHKRSAPSPKSRHYFPRFLRAEG